MFACSVLILISLDAHAQMRYPDGGAIFGRTRGDLSLERAHTHGSDILVTDQILVFSTEDAGVAPVASSSTVVQILDGDPEWTLSVNNPNVTAGDPRIITAL